MILPSNPILSQKSLVRSSSKGTRISGDVTLEPNMRTVAYPLSYHTSLTLHDCIPSIVPSISNASLNDF